MIPSEKLRIITEPDARQSNLIDRAKFAVQSVYLEAVTGTETLLLKNVKNESSEVLMVHINKDGCLSAYRYDNPNLETIQVEIDADLREYETGIDIKPFHQDSAGIFQMPDHTGNTKTGNPRDVRPQKTTEDEL